MKSFARVLKRLKQWTEELSGKVVPAPQMQPVPVRVRIR